MAKDWLFAPPRDDLPAVAQRWGVPPLIARLLLNRGVSPSGECSTFLDPQLRDLLPPRSLPGAEQAAGLIARAIGEGTRIAVYGDYDVDGTTGVAILWHVLRAAGASPSFYVPHRIEEGYGLNAEALRRMVVDDGVGLIISVDCGITAVEEARTVREHGARLIVTDHHTPKDVLPEAEVLVHPALDGAYANPYLSGAGVAFKLAWAIAQELSGAERVSPGFRELLKNLLPLAALGTIADVVPLVGENRAIARHGLRLLPESPFPGIGALIEVAGLQGRRISDYDVGFKLAPRINAAGRMGHARLAVELLTRADEARASEIAIYLEDHNRSRQSTERKITRKVQEVVERDGLASDGRRALVLAGEDWHPGVIGIVASRVVNVYHRPAVLIALSNGEGQGSARSIEGFDLASALLRCGQHLLSHGGHAMAAGLRIAAKCVEDFTEAFIETANNRLTGADLRPKLRLDAEVGLEEMTLPVAESIQRLGPFGTGNPRPVLATDWLGLADEPRCMGRKSEHFQAWFTDGRHRLRGVGFGLAERVEELKNHRRCRLAFEPLINDFDGRRTVEMQLVDMQFPG